MSKEKLKILQMIEEKIISVDEGLRLLDSLNDEKDKENVVIIDKAIFHWQKNSLSKTLDTSEEIVEHKLFENTTGFNVTFRDQKINEIFNSALQELQKSGRYQQIVENYADINLQFLFSYLLNYVKFCCLEPLI